MSAAILNVGSSRADAGFPRTGARRVTGGALVAVQSPADEAGSKRVHEARWAWAGLLVVIALLIAAPGARATTLVSGTLPSDTTWTKTDSPYLITDAAIVPAGGTLTIEPGTEVRFAALNGSSAPGTLYGKAALEVQGRLNASGTLQDPITLTSAAANPSSGDWAGVRVIAGGGAPASTFSYVRTSYARWGVKAENSNVAISHSQFFYPLSAGIQLDEGGTNNAYAWNSTIADSRVYGGDTGDGIAFEPAQPPGGLAGTLTISRTYIVRTDTGIRASLTGSGVTANITDNVIQNNRLAMQLGGSGGPGGYDIRDNSVVNNITGIYYASPVGTGTFNTSGNNLYGAIGGILGNYSSYDFIGATGPSDLTAASNWWGTTSTSAIDTDIYDSQDDNQFGTVAYAPILAAPSGSAPVVDSTPPDTSFTETPTSLVRQSSAVIGTTTTEQGEFSNIECQLDGGAWRPCDGSTTVSGLADGAHTLRARAADPSGNQDLSPASHTWTVDTTPPQTTLTARPDPAATSRSHHAGFGFSSNEAEPTFECQLDSVGWRNCLSGLVYDDVADGQHKFSVRATDPAGNTGPEATTTWSIDTTTPPSASINVSDANPETGQAITFDATASYDPKGGSITRFEWDLDGDGTYETDTGSAAKVSHANADPGQRTVRVRITDSLGLNSAAAAPIDVRLKPPAGEIGISINNGDIATNRAKVTVSLVWPQLAATALVSNDGGFGPMGATTELLVAPRASGRGGAR